MAEKTILQAYEMGNVEETKCLSDKYYTESINKMPLPDTRFGLELEIEGFPPVENRDVRWRYDTDGSLRNNGVELISHPTKAKHIEDLLINIFKAHRITEANYSERCSTHVHMNVQDWTWNQLKCMCLLYLMFERLLFAFIGNDRKDNIFCVPWYESGVSPQLIDKMQKNPNGQVRHWVKYTALNLLPVEKYGTIEFRHLHGTCNVPLIMTWLRLISRMAAYAQKTSVKALTNTVLEMNTVSNYDQFMSDVFDEDRGSLMIDDYQGQLSIGVVDTKLMLMKPSKNAAPSHQEELEQALEGIRARQRTIRIPSVATLSGDWSTPVAQAAPAPRNFNPFDAWDAATSAPAPLRNAGRMNEEVNTTEGYMTRRGVVDSNIARTRMRTMGLVAADNIQILEEEQV